VWGRGYTIRDKEEERVKLKSQALASGAGGGHVNIVEFKKKDY
jgi:hypothetical protein